MVRSTKKGVLFMNDEMPSISVDLFGSRRGETVSKEMMQTVMEGCRKTFWKLLPGLRMAVKTFRVRFVFLDNQPGPGPDIVIVFQGPLGNESSFEADHRFFGSGKPHPTSEEIANYFCAENHLPQAITKHLHQCKNDIEDAQTILRIWMNPANADLMNIAEKQFRGDGG